MRHSVWESRERGMGWANKYRNLTSCLGQPTKPSSAAASVSSAVRSISTTSWEVPCHKEKQFCQSQTREGRW